MDNKILNTYTFCFNPEENSGEGLILKTTFLSNADDEIFTNQELNLLSYGNSASINLYSSSISSSQLRKLADELDKAKNEAMFLLGKMCSEKNEKK